MKNAEKRASQVEEDSKAKTSQLEELYGQIDSMAEYLQTVESQKTEQDQHVAKLEREVAETKRSKFDVEVKLQQASIEAATL